MKTTMLETEITKALQQHAGGKVATAAVMSAPRYSTLAMQGGMGMLGITKVAGMLPAKAAVGIAAATLAVGGGATAVAVTHATNHGQAVVAAVKSCKAEYGIAASPGAKPTATHTAATGKENVGQCVSAVAREKGAQERALHAHGKGAKDNSHKPSSVHPTGAPTSHPTGKPSSLPTTGQ